MLLLIDFEEPYQLGLPIYIYIYVYVHKHLSIELQHIANQCL